MVDDLGEHARTGPGDELQLRSVVAARRQAVWRGRQPQHLAVQHREKILVHAFFWVDKVAFVDDDVAEVLEEFGMVADAADGGEGDARYFFPAEGSGVDGAIQYAVRTEFQVVLLEYLLAWLKHQRMPFEAAGNVGYHQTFSGTGGQHHDGVALLLFVVEEADGGIAGLLLVVT